MFNPLALFFLDWVINRQVCPRITTELAALREAMSALRGRYRRSKKASSNPYAGRGLDKFALVSAELEAKREKLAAQLGTPLSVVKFAIGSHSKWIPIIISSSPKNESQALRKSTADSISEDKPPLGAGISGDDPALGGPISEGKTHMSGLISEGKTHLGGLISDGKTHLSGLISEDKTSLGGLGSQDKTDQGKNRVSNSASKEGEHIAADEGETKVYQRGNSRYLMAAATAGFLWVVKAADLGIGMATAIASNVVMLRWHAKSMVKSLPATPRANLPKEESATIAQPSAAMSSPNPSPSSFSLNTASSSSSLQAHLLPLPTSPAPVRIASKNAVSVQVSREGIKEISSPHAQATKQHNKCQVKGFPKICSAPNTPRDSRRPSKPSAAAGASSLCDQAVHMDIKEERLVQKTNSRKVLRSSTSMVREMASEKGKKERTEKLGQALAAAGLVSVLGGLMMGYSAAILGVVLWWYVLPSLRKAVGDEPFVRSHHHNSITLDTQTKSKKTMTGVGSGNYDLQSQEYKKKVIMEGLLHRGQRSTA